MSTCSGNRTDCLLGELVQQGESFNWDPLNFAFTAILSILGLLVAFLALLLGLLAAGPGRLKASQNALGHVYGKTARTRFDWTEWRFRTTVQVPVIDLAQILSARLLPDHNDNPSKKNPVKTEEDDLTASQTPAKRKFRPRRCFDFERHGSDVEASAVEDIGERSEVLASWTMLLRHVGLERVEFRTKYCKTDHLPADITAAPAFASIESLVILAVLAGCTSYHVRPDAYLARGSRVQMVFRQHPSLGLVAAYQSYMERLDWDFLRLEHTRQACIEALGHIRYLRNPFVEMRSLPKGHIDVRTNLTYLFNMLRAKSKCTHKTCAHQIQQIKSWPWFFMEHDGYILSMLLVLLFADKPQVVKLFPLRLFRDFQYIHLLIKESASWRLDPFNVIETLKVLVDSEHSLLLFRSVTSRRQVAIDTQHSKLRVHHLRPLGADVASNPLVGENFAGNTRQSWFGSQASSGQDAPLKAFPVQLEHLNGVPLDEAPKMLSATDGDLMISADVLELCFHWRNDARFIYDLAVPEKNETRKWLAWQLATIDCWLKDHGGQDALCAALNLLAQQFATAKDRLKVRDGLLHPRLSILDSGLAHEAAQEATASETEDLDLGELADHGHGNHLILYKGHGDDILQDDTHSDSGRSQPSTQVNTNPHSQLLLTWPTGEAQSAVERETRQSEPHRHQTRKPREDEYYVMSVFSRHKKRCRRCPDLALMHLEEGATLCNRGWRHARDVARYIYPHEGRPYSVIDRQEGNEVELELDNNLSESILALLFAMERGLWIELFQHDDAEPVSPPPEPAATSPRRRATMRERRRDTPPPVAAADDDEDDAGTPRQRSRSRERVRPAWVPPKERVKAMETILLFRAILYSALASTATDSSDILEMRDRDEIVQVL